MERDRGGRWREGCRDAVGVDVWDYGVVLGKEGEEEGCGPGREVVEDIEGEGPEEKGEEEGRDDGC